ncbi:MFS transporter [Novosphingobium sp.]|uniref:MFS transporter n=1 Tax=Novosphingobium sp. TaxID=1874826 RepID=UPI002FDFE37C
MEVIAAGDEVAFGPSSRSPLGELGVAIILAGAFGAVMLDRMIQLFLAPALSEDLHLTASQLGVLAGVVSFAWAVSTVLFGVISDRVGRKRVIVPAVIAFSIMSILSGLARNYHELLMARALLGLCEGPCWSVIMALMADLSSESRRGRNIGIINCVGALAGSALAPIFATQIAAAFGWRMAFFLAGIPGFVFALGILLWVPEHKRIPPKTKEPPHLAEIVKSPDMWLCLLAATCFTTFLMSFSLFAPLFLSKASGLDGRTIGYVMALSGAGGVVYGLLGPASSDRFGYTRVLLVCAAASALLAILFLTGPNLPWPLLGFGAFILTTVPAVGTLLLVLLPVAFAPARAAASAIGFVAIGAEGVGAALGPVIAGYASDHWGMSAPLLLCTGTMCVVMVIGLILHQKSRASRSKRSTE